MKKIILLQLLLSLPFLSIFSQTITINGYVEDAETGEKLIGAVVSEVYANNNVVTNEYVFFSISVFGIKSPDRVI